MLRGFEMGFRGRAVLFSNRLKTSLDDMWQLSADVDGPLSSVLDVRNMNSNNASIISDTAQPAVNEPDAYATRIAQVLSSYW